MRDIRPEGIVARDSGRGFDALVKKFIRLVRSSGIMQELRDREYAQTRRQRRRAKDGRAAFNAREREERHG